jgi:hypothetical protein
MSLYELTGGNYRVHRVVSYPEFADSELVFDVEVKTAGDSEWSTTITISGAYNGPTDVVSVRDYELDWTRDGDTIVEKGAATLELSSGETLRSEWTSSIETEARRLAAFPAGGEVVSVTYTPFRIDGNKMSYEWQGSVRAKGSAR